MYSHPYYTFFVWVHPLKLFYNNIKIAEICYHKSLTRFPNYLSWLKSAEKKLALLGERKNIMKLKKYNLWCLPVRLRRKPVCFSDFILISFQMCVCVCMYMHMHVYLRMCIYVYAYIWVCTYMCMCVYVCAYMYMYICECVCVWIHLSYRDLC